MLLLQDIRRDASLAACTAGKSNPTKIPMMAMTTNNSTNVNPRIPTKVGFLLDFVFCFRDCMWPLFLNESTFKRML
jgi:hypothetical protein